MLCACWIEITAFYIALVAMKEVIPFRDAAVSKYFASALNFTFLDAGRHAVEFLFLLDSKGRLEGAAVNYNVIVFVLSGAGF